MNVTGEELIRLGFKPEKWFKDALAHINSHPMAEAQMLEYLE